MRIQAFLFSILSTILLTSCGGGGGADAPRAGTARPYILEKEVATGTAMPQHRQTVVLRLEGNNPVEVEEEDTAEGGSDLIPLSFSERGIYLRSFVLEDTRLRVKIFDGGSREVALLDRDHTSAAVLFEESFYTISVEQTALDNEEIVVFLRDGASLISGSCPGCNLQGIDLSGARLDGADFSGADFSGAKLEGIVCGSASFRNADLRGANLQGADCANADFSGALLDAADLAGAKLSGSNNGNTAAAMISSSAASGFPNPIVFSGTDALITKDHPLFVISNAGPLLVSFNNLTMEEGSSLDVEPLKGGVTFNIAALVAQGKGALIFVHGKDGEAGNDGIPGSINGKPGQDGSAADIVNIQVGQLSGAFTILSRGGNGGKGGDGLPSTSFLTPCSYDSDCAGNGGNGGNGGAEGGVFIRVESLASDAKIIPNAKASSGGAGGLEGDWNVSSEPVSHRHGQNGVAGASGAPGLIFVNGEAVK